MSVTASYGGGASSSEEELNSALDSFLTQVFEAASNSGGGGDVGGESKSCSFWCGCVGDRGDVKGNLGEVAAE